MCAHLRPLIHSSTHTIKQTEIISKVIHIVWYYKMWNLYMVFLSLSFFESVPSGVTLLLYVSELRPLPHSVRRYTSPSGGPSPLPFPFFQTPFSHTLCNLLTGQSVPPTSCHSLYSSVSIEPWSRVNRNGHDSPEIPNKFDTSQNFFTPQTTQFFFDVPPTSPETIVR